MAPPMTIVTAYGPITQGLTWAPVNTGFSGSRVCCGTDSEGIPTLALKAWPAGTSRLPLQFIHTQMQIANSIPGVPRVLADNAGSTIITNADIHYDLTTWMPGTPATAPTSTQILAAIGTLAAIHTIWARDATGPVPIPSVHRRQSAWEKLVLPTPPFRTGDSGLNEALAQAYGVVLQHKKYVSAELDAWLNVLLPSHPCLCDCHEGHLLFTGDRVTGLIDFGGMKVDHPVTDLARLLADYGDHFYDAIPLGLGEYHRLRPQVDVHPDLVNALIMSGTVGGLVHWLLRAGAGETFARPVQVTARVIRLLQRTRRLFGI